MPKANVNGIDLYYEVTGLAGGPWLTFSNSLRTDHTMWAPQVQAFSRDFRILTYDVRGHGQSDATDGPYSADLLCHDLTRLWDHLGIVKSHFAGLSLGGMTGMRLGTDYANYIDKLIICDCRGDSPADTVVSWKNRSDIVAEKGVSALVKGSVDAWFDDDYQMRNRDFVAAIGQSIAQTDPRGYIGCALGMLSNLDMAARIGEIKAKTLFVVGSEDGPHPALMKAMHDGLPGSKYALIEGGSHLSNLSHAQAFNDALRAFLTEG